MHACIKKCMHACMYALENMCFVRVFVCEFCFTCVGYMLQGHYQDAVDLVERYSFRPVIKKALRAWVQSGGMHRVGRGVYESGVSV